MDWVTVPVNLKLLIDDLNYQVLNKVYSIDEMAARSSKCERYRQRCRMSFNGLALSWTSLYLFHGLPRSTMHGIFVKRKIAMLSMNDIDLQNKRVLIREDLNVPIQDGVITSTTRLKSTLPTIQLALQQNAAVILLSHLGRPEEGEFSEANSLALVAVKLGELLGQPVKLVRDYLNGLDIQPGEVVLCENVRFNVGEKADSDDLAKRYAALCDVFVMDAFATAHRAQASTHGVAKYAPVACAGPLLNKELTALSTALAEPKKPVMAIVGGSKVSTKLDVLSALIEKVDCLIVGGGIANTFIAAQGFNVGKSLYEEDLIPTCKKLLEQAEASNVTIPLPNDVIVAKEFSADAKAEIKRITDIDADDMILDIGPATARHMATDLMNAKTILWNGPVGVFEFPAFAAGTEVVADAIASSSAFSIAGGGDTLAAIEKFEISNHISYMSTGGGAFLKYIEGKALPAVEILKESCKAA